MKLNTSQKQPLIYATIIASLVSLLIMSQFAAAIITACIFAVIFVPFNNWLTKRTKKPALAISLTTIISIFTIIIPLIFVVWISVGQVENMINDVTTLIDSGDTSLTEDQVLIFINEKLDNLTGGRVELSLEQIESYALNAARAVGEGTLNFLTSTIGSIPSLVTNVIIFFYVFVALLGNYKALLDFLRKLNPLGDEVSWLFIERAKNMTNSMVKGQFAVAIAQGAIGALSLQLAGLGYFAFFALLLTVLSLVPLGGGIITLPAGIIMILFGNISGGLIVLLTHIVIVTNIDNYIRPKLVPKEISLHPALTMISVFSGLALFGFLGIVVGPVLFIVAVTTMQIYIKVANDSKKSKLKRT